MMSLFNILLMILFSFLAHKYIAIWWLFLPVTGLVSFAFGQSTWKAFYTGFLSIFILWLGLILSISFLNDFILVEKMSQLFSLPSFVLIIINLLIGSILGAIGSVLGYLLKTISDK